MRKVSVFAVFCAVMLFCSSCGYHMGSTMHPQVSNIAIGKVINDTAVYNASVQLQQALAEQFMVDGSLKVVNLGNAQAIIYSRIVNIGYSMYSSRAAASGGVYRAAEWQARVAVEFSVILPGEREPLIPRQVVYGEAYFRQQADLEVQRSRAVQMALRNAAKKIVQNTTELW